MEEFKVKFKPFIVKFIITHVITYIVVGIVFLLISNYFDYFASHDVMKDLMRPADSIWVGLAPVFQILRGALLGSVLFSFRKVILFEKNGWLKLFGVLWVLTGIGAVITGPGSIEGFLYTKIGFGNLFIGWPEITIQMFAFSFLFAKWMKKSIEKNMLEKRI